MNEMQLVVGAIRDIRGVFSTVGGTISTMEVYNPVLYIVLLGDTISILWGAFGTFGYTISNEEGYHPVL